MSSTTSRAAFYKPAGGEDINVTTDLNNNLDKIDTNLNFRVVASSAAKNAISPYWAGLNVRETDTGRTFVSNGTAPISASWSQIPNSGSTFDADLDLTAGKQVNIGLTASTARYAALSSTVSTDFLGSRITADTVDRFVMNADGAMYWGPGNASQDTKLYRSAANTLTTDDSLTVALDLTVSGNASVVGNQTVTGNLAVSGIGQVLFAYKTADTGRATATLSNDPHLTFNLDANSVYMMTGVLITNTTDATNADFNLDFVIPSGAVGFWSGLGQPTTATTNDGTVRTLTTDLSAARTYGGITGAENLGISLSGMAVTTNAGTYALSWARTGGSGTATLKQFSYMYLTKVG